MVASFVKSFFLVHTVWALTKHLQPDATSGASCPFKISRWNQAQPSKIAAIDPHDRLGEQNMVGAAKMEHDSLLARVIEDAEMRNGAYAAAVFKPPLNLSVADTTQVAYCINGLARTFVLPMVHKSIFRNLIPSFGGQATVFAVMVPFEEHSAAIVYDDGARQKGTTVLKLREVLESIGVTRFEIDAHDVLNQDIAAIARKTPCQDYVKDELYTTFVAQLVHSRACWNEMTTYEDKFGVTFDKIVYSRPDVTWYSPVAHHTNENIWAPGSPVSNAGGMDHAMFGTRAVMETFFKRLDWHEENCIAGDGGIPLDFGMGVADGLPFYFRARGLQLRTANLPCVIVRDDGAMKTAKDACRWIKGDFGGRKRNCMCALYQDDGTGNPWGKPHSDSSGLWW